MNFPPGQAPTFNPPGGFCNSNAGFACNRVMVIQMARWEIAIDPADGVPSLYRSRTGRADPTTGDAIAGPPGAGWQLVARGIEDMQVQYKNGTNDPQDDADWADDPGLVVMNNYTTIVRQVRVTLQARTMGTDVRGQLSAVVAPRAALWSLAGDQPATQQWK